MGGESFSHHQDTMDGLNSMNSMDTEMDEVTPHWGKQNGMSTRSPPFGRRLRQRHQRGAMSSRELFTDHDNRYRLGYHNSAYSSKGGGVHFGPRQAMTCQPIRGTGRERRAQRPNSQF